MKYLQNLRQMCEHLNTNSCCRNFPDMSWKARGTCQGSSGRCPGRVQYAQLHHSQSKIYVETLMLFKLGVVLFYLMHLPLNAKTYLSTELMVLLGLESPGRLWGKSCTNIVSKDFVVPSYDRKSTTISM